MRELGKKSKNDLELLFTNCHECNKILAQNLQTLHEILKCLSIFSI